ncbi:MAG: hypothetical protein HKN78_11480 [Sphingomonadaceae bacterium]|nr:hypothetical protein [Sphingomonadaceae bacterium]
MRYAPPPNRAGLCSGFFSIRLGRRLLERSFIFGLSLVQRSGGLVELTFFGACQALLIACRAARGQANWSGEKKDDSVQHIVRHPAISRRRKYLDPAKEKAAPRAGHGLVL